MGMCNPNWKGSGNVKAKLDECAVSEIRESYAGERETPTQLARRFSVSRSAIKHVLHGRSWRHLPESHAEVQDELEYEESQQRLTLSIRADQENRLREQREAYLAYLVERRQARRAHENETADTARS